jgi:two-component system sensor histidine kinase ChiS
MLGNSSMIQEVYGPKNDTKLKELANDIHESCVRLIKIVTNFLDAARLEGGKMPMKIESIGIEKPVAAAVGELQALGKEKNLYIKTELPPALPQVLADGEKVQQIIYNLIGNAMKFTETGGITISAEASPAVVAITVTDTGRGISKDGQQTLFKSFQQTQAGDENMGSGLGLYISKLLVERMGGHIWLEASEEGKGTSIAFSLPVTPGQTHITTTPAKPAPKLTDESKPGTIDQSKTT